MSDNPDFVMPPKPKECQRGSGPAFYNIDFSLANQLKLAGQVAPEQPAANTDIQQKRAARIRRLNKPEQRNPTGGSGSSETVLRGMRETAKRKNALDSNMGNNGHHNDNEEIAGRRWDEQIERPQLNYSEFFEEGAGHIAGITCWEIENFVPKQLERQLNGTFYTGDCYIVLHSMVELSGNMDWNIFFWIGKDATVGIRSLKFFLILLDLFSWINKHVQQCMQLIYEICLEHHVELNVKNKLMNQKNF